METQTHRKIGRNKGKPRLWIEGQALNEAGLGHGKAWILVDVQGGFDIARVDLEPGSKFAGHRVRKIAGTSDRPVIDIAGASLSSLEVQGEMPATVRLSYGQDGGCITVRRDTRNTTEGLDS